MCTLHCVQWHTPLCWYNYSPNLPDTNQLYVYIALLTVTYTSIQVQLFTQPPWYKPILCAYCTVYSEIHQYTCIIIHPTSLILTNQNSTLQWIKWHIQVYSFQPNKAVFVGEWPVAILWTLDKHKWRCWDLLHTFSYAPGIQGEDDVKKALCQTNGTLNTNRHSIFS